MLTGDEQMDAMIPDLMDLVNAARELDGPKYGELTRRATEKLREQGIEEHLIGWYMFTIAVSMIPYDTSPEELLRWHRIANDKMEKLLAQGFSRGEAAYIINARARDERAREEGEG